jgi:AraC-like DNA-binding protein
MILEGLHEKEIFTEQYPFRLVVNTMEVFQYPLHWHNAIELVYNTKGICTLIAAGMEYSLNEGELLLIPSGEIHEISSCTKGGKRVFIQFNISALDGFGGISAIKPFMEKVIKIGAGEDAQLHGSVENCVSGLISEYVRKEYAYALSVNARVFDLLVMISRSLAAKSGLSDNTARSGKMIGLSQIDHAFEYIEKNYSSEITLKDVSNAVGFSEYYFSRLFKEYTGQNLHNYLNTYRVKQAEKLLRNSDLQITDIALESGFNSLVTFNRIFRKVKGCAPTRYRKAGM